MTTFQQALHIFRKDVRHLRFEIAGILLLLIVLVLTGVQTWEGLQARGGPALRDAGYPVFWGAPDWGLAYESGPCGSYRKLCRSGAA